MPDPFYAISYTPPPFSPLAKFGARILGYDCFEAIDVPQLAVPGLDPPILSLLTVEPRRLGFQACLVPPFRLQDNSESDLCAAIESLARHHYPIPLGPLVLAHTGSFIVLRAERQSLQLQEFVAECHAAFDAQGIDGHEMNAVNAAPTSAGFRFQMTLAGPTDAPDDAMNHLAKAFERLSGDEVELGAISLMRQDDGAGRFRVLLRTPLTGR